MKSGKFDIPIDFADDYLLIDKYHVQYIDLHEIAQGSPWIGYLSINGDMIYGYRFGGPFLFEDPYLYIPALQRYSFRIARIDLRNCEFDFIGHLRDYICLEKIENNKIYFYDSSTFSSLKMFDMNDYKISNQTDTPVHFTSIIQTEQNTIEYKNITGKVGGVLTGNIYINNQPISKYLFGAPFLFTESDIIIPIFVKKLWMSGFRIGLIDLLNNEVKIIGEKEEMIFLEKVDHHTISYYTDLEKKILCHQQIPSFVYL